QIPPRVLLLAQGASAMLGTTSCSTLLRPHRPIGSRLCYTLQTKSTQPLPIHLLNPLLPWRTSPAVERRCQSAGPPQAAVPRWKGRHNLDCRASDGKTPAARFFRRAFPDLFETLLSKIEDLPRPRKPKHAMVLTR